MYYSIAGVLNPVFSSYKFSDHILPRYLLKSYELNVVTASDFARWTRDPDIAMSKTHPTPRKPPSSHLGTDNGDSFWQDWNECWNREDFHALGDIDPIQNLAYTKHASSYSTDSFNKLCSQAAKNLNSHCPWSSKRETYGVLGLSVLHYCLTSESKATAIWNSRGVLNHARKGRILKQHSIYLKWKSCTFNACLNRWPNATRSFIVVIIYITM